MLADPYDAILLDLDGVLYRWPEPIDGAPEAVRRLRAAGKRIAFVTNTSAPRRRSPIGWHPSASTRTPARS